MTGNLNITGSATNALIFDDTINDKKIQMNATNGFGVRSDGLGFYSGGSFTFRNSTLSTTIFSVDSAGNMSFGGTIYPAQGVSSSANIRGGTGTFGTTVSTGATLTINSTTQLLPRILLSGQEFYQAANTQATGIALLLGVNRTGNKQLWIADSTNLTQTTTTPVLRLNTTGIDCVATDGVTAKVINIGNSAGIFLGGNVGINKSSPNCKLYIDSANGNTTSTTFSIRIGSNGSIADGGAYPNLIGFGVEANGWSKGAIGWVRTSPYDVGDMVFINNNDASGSSDASMSYERMRLRSDGNFGIGTNSPQTKLDVRGTLYLKGNSGTAAPATGDYGGTGERLILWNGGVGSYSYALGIDGGTLWYGVPSNAVHKFYVAGDVKMIIASSGYVGINNNNPVGMLTLGNSGNAGSDGHLVIGKQDNSGGTRHLRMGYNSGFSFVFGDYGNNNTAGTWVEQFRIIYSAPANTLVCYGDGNVGTKFGNVVSTSDERLKTDIYTIENALEKTLLLRGVNFTYIQEQKKSMGLISQEVELIIPEVVHEYDGIKSIAYSNIIGLLVEAIKEQQKQINELRNILIKNNLS